MPILIDGERAPYYNPYQGDVAEWMFKSYLEEIFLTVCTTPIEERTPNGFVRLEDGRFGLGFWLTIEEERRSTGTILGMDADKFEEKRERAIELMKLHDVALWGL